jgi:hypothetical protein
MLNPNALLSLGDVASLTTDRPQAGDTVEALLAKSAYRQFSSEVAIARPADTTAYTAGDAIGATGGSAHLTFTGLGRPRADGVRLMLRSATLMIAATAVPAGMTTLRLHLYTAAPDAIADNAVWDLSSAGDRLKYLGYIEFAAPTDLGSTLWSQLDGINKQLLLSSSTQLVGVLQTVGGFTPAASTAFTVRLHGETL